MIEVVICKISLIKPTPSPNAGQAQASAMKWLVECQGLGMGSVLGKADVIERKKTNQS
jgi:hypothetical protein